MARAWRALWMLAAGGLILWRAPLAWASWREWRQWRILDPSAADLYLTDFWFEIAPVTIGAAIQVGAILFRDRGASRD